MSISAAGISHAIHGLSRHSGAHPRSGADPTQPFGQQLDAVAGQSQQSPFTSASQQPAGGQSPGALLSSDLLQALQAIR
jgi:hypothetical protein